MKAKPNIVFIMADQLSASFIGCYGSHVDSTPNLDALASSGMRFTRNYAASPVCAPNRACILTGRSNFINGIVTNNFVLSNNHPVYPFLMKQNNYTTGGFGKFHVTPMMWEVPSSLDFLGFDESVVTEDPKWGPYIDWIIKHHPKSLDMAIAYTNDHSGMIGSFAERERMQGATPEEIEIKNESFQKYLLPRIEHSKWSRMYPSDLPSRAHDTSYITELGIDFIERHKSDKKPFFCHISYVDPHDPYNPPYPYCELFKPEEMTDPVPQEWDAQELTFLSECQDNYLGFSKIANNLDAIRKLRALYHGSVKFMDDQIGRIIDKVKREGLWDNTIFVFTTDHGDPMGDHGLVSKGVAHYDSCVRTPLIVSGGKISSGVSSRLTTSLDLYPTFCEWAGIPCHLLPPLEGISLVDACEGKLVDPHSEIGISIDRCSTVITRDGYRMTVHAGAKVEGQLFHLFDDSDEQRNLYYNPEHCKLKEHLFELLIRTKIEPTLTPQYSVLPVKDNRAYTNGSCTSSIPVYNQPPSPWHENADKPCWRGR